MWFVVRQVGVQWINKANTDSPEKKHGSGAIIRFCNRWLIFSVLLLSWADVKYHVPTRRLFHLGFFAVKRRAVFILGAMWWALVRGWRRDCVVGGMETRFQWRKAHSRTAKCEAFHVAPRLFFMFLFLIPFTIRQHCIIYPREFSTVPMFFCSMGVVFFVERWGGNKEAVSQRLGNCFCDLESSG